MEIFRGKQKEKMIKTSFSENARVMRNRLTKIPERVMDIDVYPTPLKEGTVFVTEQNAESTFKGFLREHKDLFAVEPEDLEMVSAKKINTRWYIKYRQLYKGIPVHNVTVGLDSTENGKVGSYAANYQPHIEVPTEPKVNLEEAVAIAKKTYKGKKSAGLKTRERGLIIYPEKAEETITYHLAWKIMLAGDEPDPEIERYFIINALDGTILQSYTARFPDAQVTGTVEGEIYPENPTDPVTKRPFRNEYVDIESAGQTTTNSAGIFTMPASAPFSSKLATFTLEGPYVRVQNNNGADYKKTKNCSTSSPCDITWTASDRDHINLFYHMNLFHDWLKDELGHSWVNLDGTSRFNARVNYAFANAFAGDPLQFGTDVWARSSDVIYHECTHNVLYHIYGNWIGFPATYSEAYAMDEGFSDYFANSFTNDSIFGEGCASNRDHNNTKKYPGKSSYSDEGHTGGMLIGGACWDLRQRLINAQGVSGARVADKLILEAHQILSIYPRDYYFTDPHESNLLLALYKAADTDNNLLNGFPYFNDIQLAFHAHDLLQAILEEDDSIDFSTNKLGYLSGGDLYYSSGKFWANNLHQQGVTDLGNIGNVDLAGISIPNSGYTRFGVNAVAGHTYLSLAQEGETGGYIAFQVIAINADQSKVTIRYLYRFSPDQYVANTNSKEIHKLDCHWVSLMKATHKLYCNNLNEVATFIKNSGYNGCHYCLPRYDTDTRSLEQVLENLDEDLA